MTNKETYGRDNIEFTYNPEMPDTVCAYYKYGKNKFLIDILVDNDVIGIWSLMDT